MHMNGTYAAWNLERGGILLAAAAIVNGPEVTQNYIVQEKPKTTREATKTQPHRKKQTYEYN